MLSALFLPTISLSSASSEKLEHILQYREGSSTPVFSFSCPPRTRTASRPHSILPPVRVRVRPGPDCGASTTRRSPPLTSQAETELELGRGGRGRADRGRSRRGWAAAGPAAPRQLVEGERASERASDRVRVRQQTGRPGKRSPPSVCASVLASRWAASWRRRGGGAHSCACGTTASCELAC